MATMQPPQIGSGDDITTNNTMTVMKMKKKRTYKRKDCRGDMPAVKKKRIDTNTSTAIENKRKDCHGTDTPTVTEKNKRAYRRKKYLPHDLIMEEILTKLPVPTLLTSVLVSRLWDDDGVVQKPQYGCHFFRFDTEMFKGKRNILQFDRFRGRALGRGIFEMGRFSLYLSSSQSWERHLQNPHHLPRLWVDPSANEYKLVSIFCTPQKELNLLVFTLGTKSWRNVTATTTPVLGRPVLKIRVPTGSDKSAIFCTTSSSSSGYLVWKILVTLGGAGSHHIQPDNSNVVNNEIEMLLSFNLHDDKICFIQLPAKRTTEEQQKHLLVDYPHILEFMGSPCIARIEKRSGKGSDYPHIFRDGHQGIGSSNSCCCCCCKVHLYVLKDKVKQVWVKEESFEVCTNSTPNYVTPDPCCFCFGSTTTTPPTRIFSFSGQILLYWFNGKHLQVYNLHSQRLQLVVTADTIEDKIFWSKRKEPLHMNISGDDDIYCSSMDYQLQCHEENYLSLETFIPGGVEGVNADDFSHSDMDRCWAYWFINRSSRLYFPSYK
ncbi:uncharacterized protein LOC113340086 isoform X2 [Papaver somniferum]|uniref:uncharacterized protein LOC113340086 isoform X2 n=1 Tax=Papaver somniferum TaxID=3469 RepID=UPI000E7027BF|nr:uncharacterized protein LOC113340086 isoform X2 [Papaver somniferum]